MKYLLGVLATVLILFALSQKESTIQQLNPQDSILAFGDSLTYGYNAKSDESYPTLLSHLSGHKVINAGIPAESSHDGLKRLPKLLEDNSIKLMILFFGGNDIMQGLSMENLKSNLKTMIQMTKEKNIKVLLISVPNLSLFGLSPLELYEEVADEEDVPLLSGMLADIISKPSLKSDQIHPNDTGYKIMAEKIYEKLLQEGFILPQ
jgi:lysophospholipase L1-like esterase